jgi:hypothetical protein
MERIQHLAPAARVGGRLLSPLPSRGWLDWAAGPEELAACGREADKAVARLVRAGNPAGMVTRFLASVHDGLYVGLPATPRRPSGRRRTRMRCWCWAAAPAGRARYAPTRTMPWCWPATSRWGQAPGLRPWPTD